MTTAYDLAKTEVGTVEWRDGSNPKVGAYFRDAGAAHVKDDATAWCAAFLGAMLARSGGKGTGKLNARSYMDWGRSVDLANAREGDIAVFERGNDGWSGHVGFFVRETKASVMVLGGNQSDQVSVAAYPKAKLLGIRRAAIPLAPVRIPETPRAPEIGFWASLIEALRGIWKGRA